MEHSGQGTMPATHVLYLEVTYFTDADHWRCRLTTANGDFLTDHEVSLDPAEVEHGAFVDLRAYLDHYAAPDKWPDHHVRLINEAGAWIGEHVLGPVALSIVEHGTPVVVRVMVPPEADRLIHRPFEIAHAHGIPLAMQDVSLVFEVAEKRSKVHHQPVRDRLRMLAIFSLPTDVATLALRRERYELERFMHGLAETRGLAIELCVLQYGVTRETLREVMEEGEGWDVIHFSGHGLPGSLVLERPDSTHDVVNAGELGQLLHAARGRLKMVTLSSCLSAAATIDETLRWLRIEARTRPRVPSNGPPQTEEVSPLPAVARALVRELDCAVLAMRYPVGDDFAIGLAAEVYDRLFDKEQALPRALQLGLPQALRDGPSRGIPPLSVATPALFGRQAVDLALKLPKSAETGFALPRTSLAYFPDEPERFVGRVGPMSRASQALAEESGKSGVLFHGMAGAGKTACAVELAYRYKAGRFQGFVWHKAPDEGSDVEGALLRLALDMETQLSEFTMVHVVDRADEFAAWLPRLTELLEQRSILIVLDNLESLLTDDGRWRDERWGQLVAAMLNHGGLSRVVLTSRRRPADLPEDGRLLVEPIHALSLDEAALLARELPNLRALLRGDGGVPLAEGRDLVRRTLRVVQGHPKLIELAEGQASDPESLTGHLKRAERAWAEREQQLCAFFEEGESTVAAEEFLGALEWWTHATSAALPAPSRVLFHFLCALEEDDRRSAVLKANWEALWRRLDKPGEAPDLAATMAPVAAAALIEAAAVPPGEEQEGKAFTYNVHPCVAEGGRGDAGHAFRAAVDDQLGAFWAMCFAHGQTGEMRGGSRLAVLSGLSGAVYLLRRQRWEEAGALLEGALVRNPSPQMVATVLPLLRRIADATDRLEAVGVVANALAEIGHRLEAERMMREIIRRAVDVGDFRVASSIAADLVNVLLDTGRYNEALALVGDMKGYAGRASLGPWSQVSSEGLRLQVLHALGRHEEVLSEVDGLRAQMNALPEHLGQNETVHPWNVREGVLGAGRDAALALERWELAFALNAEVIAAKEARAAPLLEVAHTRFMDCGPLMRLGLYAEARDTLRACRTVYVQEGDVAGLGRVFSALGALEHYLGHRDQAIAFDLMALRHKYQAGSPEDCAISHANLANYMVLTQQPKAGIPHRLAACMIRFQTGSSEWPPACQVLAHHLALFSAEPPPLPSSFDELCQIVEAVEGVRFRELFERLPRRAADGDEALRKVIEAAQQIQRESEQDDSA